MCKIVTILSYEAQKQLFVVVTSVITKMSVAAASLYNNSNALTTKNFFLFNVHGSARRKYIPIYIYPTRCNFTQFIHIWKLLYMFRVVPPPITRSRQEHQTRTVDIHMWPHTV
jgi:hypothetical protein